MGIQQDIQTLLDRHHADAGFSGGALVKRGDDTVVHAAYGLAHRGFRVPNTVDTRFDIASVTKISDDVTVSRCLTHTAASPTTPSTRPS